MSKRLSKLAPCPFCDGQPTIEKTLRNGYADGEPDAWAWSMVCLSCAASGPWGKSEARAVHAWNRRYHVGSTSRMIETLVGMVLAGDPWKRAVAQWTWEWGRGPDLSNVAALVALREAVRQFAADYGQDLRKLYADWNVVVKALCRADRAAGRKAGRRAKA